MSKIVSAEALRKSLSEERMSPEKPRSPVKADPSPAGAPTPSPAVGSPLAAGGGTGTLQRTVISTPIKSPQATAALAPTRPSRKYKMALSILYYFQYNSNCIRAAIPTDKTDKEITGNVPRTIENLFSLVAAFVPTSQNVKLSQNLI